MPCGNSGHEHPPWPEQGAHEFIIEACENHCGWCDYQTKSSNNLRVHANRHLKNEPTLRGIKIVKGRAGRKKLQMGSRRFTAPETRDQSGSVFVESLKEGKKVNESGEGNVDFVLEAKRDSRPDSRMPFSSGPNPPRLTPLEPSSSMQDPSQSRGNQAQDTTLWPRPPANYGSNLLVSSGLQPGMHSPKEDHYRQNPSDHETQVAAPKIADSSPCPGFPSWTDIGFDEDSISYFSAKFEKHLLTRNLPNSSQDLSGPSAASPHSDTTRTDIQNQNTGLTRTRMCPLQLSPRSITHIRKKILLPLLRKPWLKLYVPLMMYCAGKLHAMGNLREIETFLLSAALNLQKEDDITRTSYFSFCNALTYYIERSIPQLGYGVDLISYEEQTYSHEASYSLAYFKSVCIRIYSEAHIVDGTIEKQGRLWICDRPYCPIFGLDLLRREYFLTHIRHYHEEDVGYTTNEELADCKADPQIWGFYEYAQLSRRSEYPQISRLWLVGDEELAGCKIHPRIWRCSRCLDVQFDDMKWLCVFCKISCEEPRIKARITLREKLASIESGKDITLQGSGPGSSSVSQKQGRTSFSDALPSGIGSQDLLQPQASSDETPQSRWPSAAIAAGNTPSLRIWHRRDTASQSSEQLLQPSQEKGGHVTVQSLEIMASSQRATQPPMTSTVPKSDSSWNPTRIFDEWNKTFGTKSAITANTEPSRRAWYPQGTVVSQSNEQALEPNQEGDSLVANVISPSLNSNSSQPGWYLCPVKGCGFMYTLSELNNHLRGRHNILVSMKIVEGDIRYQCAAVKPTGYTCGSDFVPFANLMFHLDFFHGVKDLGAS
ncbi:hypothetical protein V8E51_018867 [Hyaloscypha variabilis]